MTTFTFSVSAPTGIIYSVDLPQIADMSLSQLSHLSCAVYQIECDGHPLDANQTLFDKAHRAMTSWVFDLDCDGRPAPTEQEQLDYFIGQLHAVLTAITAPTITGTLPQSIRFALMSIPAIITCSVTSALLAMAVGYDAPILAILSLIAGV